MKVIKIEIHTDENVGILHDGKMQFKFATIKILLNFISLGEVGGKFD